MGRVLRPCLDCGAPSAGARCPTHTRAQREKYGPEHRAQRVAWVPSVAAGTVCCWRCEELISPAEAWDLGHRPDGMRAPEHAGRCNRSAAATTGSGE